MTPHEIISKANEKAKADIQRGYQHLPPHIQDINFRMAVEHHTLALIRLETERQHNILNGPRSRQVRSISLNFNFLLHPAVVLGAN